MNTKEPIKRVCINCKHYEYPSYILLDRRKKTIKGYCHHFGHQIMWRNPEKETLCFKGGAFRPKR